LAGFLNNEADYSTCTLACLIFNLTGDFDRLLRIGEGNLVADIKLAGFIITILFLFSKLLAS